MIKTRTKTKTTTTLGLNEAYLITRTSFIRN